MQLINIPTMMSVVEHIAVAENEPIFLWGPPGCGKSQGVAQAAKDHDADLIDIRLGQYDSVDLRGIPFVETPPDEAVRFSLTTWAQPATMPFIGNPRYDPDRKKYLFLDEANAGKPAVLGVAYQLIQEGRIGEHVLMPNTFIIAAGNREGDRGVTNKLPAPLANRMTHFEVGPDAKAWVEWAAGQPRMPAELLALLMFRPDLITDFDPMSPEKAFATPRTIEKAGRFYTAPGLQGEAMEHVRDAAIEGCVGKDFANWFGAFCRTTHNMVPIEDIEKDPLGTPVSEKGEIRWMTAVGIAGVMAQRPESSQALHLYLKRMDPEYIILAWQIGLTKNEQLIGQPGFLEMAKTQQAIFGPIAAERGARR